jgi:Immunity protein 70
MGLYLCVFEDDEELDGVEVGLYSDFSDFRRTVTSRLECGDPGSRFPTLILHSDCDGDWSSSECFVLRAELLQISVELHEFPGVEFQSPWQKEVAKTFGVEVNSLYDTFIDVDGEPLIQRMIGLCDIAIARGVSILFQ